MVVTSIGTDFGTSGALRETINRENAVRLQAERLEEERQASEGRAEIRRKLFRPQFLNSTTEDLEQIGLVFNRKLRFVLDLDSKEVIVKVVDRDTDKVIRELPPEELQRLHKQLEETIGFLFDARV